MKKIIDDLTIKEFRLEAHDKWKEYAAAEKKFRTPEYTDLKKVYAQLKNGKKVVDIFKVIQKGGVHIHWHPKMAIAQVKAKKVTCFYSKDGNVQYLNDHTSQWNIKKTDVSLVNCLPKFDPTRLFTKESWGYPEKFQLKAPVPPVPPRFLPKSITDDLYILWEVDRWEMVPPTDPWLLRRITKTLFVALAGWDLTDVEKSVMHGRMY